MKIRRAAKCFFVTAFGREFRVGRYYVRTAKWGVTTYKWGVVRRWPLFPGLWLAKFN